MKPLQFLTNCVNWPREDVHREGGLCDMIQSAKNITRQTFLKHVDRVDLNELEYRFGYYPADRTARLRMSKDWAVGYHRGQLHGRRVYFFKQSAIEYVFADDETARKVKGSV